MAVVGAVEVEVEVVGRLTKRRKGEEEQEEQGGGVEFGGGDRIAVIEGGSGWASSGGGMVKFEDAKPPRLPYLPVPKNDIRRHIPAMFVNALNSGSPVVLLNFYATFMQGCCAYNELNCVNLQLDLPTNISFKGPQRMVNYL
ncbi:hypothetical protein B484DRAFT_407368 [Ochromonadaceae sp. CCMP2298]|nr:hypothetical protein B484DRAFT_407368 [Ochromonadaceae sp. CCMP2298]